jgi:hypothetical protein
MPAGHKTSCFDPSLLWARPDTNSTEGRRGIHERHLADDLADAEPRDLARRLRADQEFALERGEKTDSTGLPS